MNRSLTFLPAVFGLGLLVGRGLPAVADAPAPPAVVALADAPTLVAPSGKATVRRLAGEPEGTGHAFVAILDIDAGAGVPTHRDPTEEFVYVLQGGGTITIDGKPFEIGPETGVFMPANAEVSFAAREDGPTRVLQVFAPRGPEVKYEAWQEPKP